MRHVKGGNGSKSVSNTLNQPWSTVQEHLQQIDEVSRSLQHFPNDKKFENLDDVHKISISRYFAQKPIVIFIDPALKICTLDGKRVITHQWLKINLLKIYLFELNVKETLLSGPSNICEKPPFTRVFTSKHNRENKERVGWELLVFFGRDKMCFSCIYSMNSSNENRALSIHRSKEWQSEVSLFLRQTSNELSVPVNAKRWIREHADCNEIPGQTKNFPIFSTNQEETLKTRK